MATVSSTAPRLAPKCPPHCETVSIKKYLNSSETSSRLFIDNILKSEGLFILSKNSYFVSLKN